MKILITGTPGTGKTTNGRKLAERLGIPYINVTSIINSHPEFIDNYEGKVRIIKPEIKDWLEKNLPKEYVIDSHLIEYMPKVDIVVILRCEPNELYKRLKERNYSPKKIKDNIEVEILDYFTQKTRKKKVIEVDTTKEESDKVVEEIIRRIREEDWNKGEIKWNKKKYLELVSKL